MDSVEEEIKKFSQSRAHDSQAADKTTEAQSLKEKWEKIHERDRWGNFRVRENLRIIAITAAYLTALTFAALCLRYIWNIWNDEEKIVSLLREIIGISAGLLLGQFFRIKFFQKQPQ